MTQEELPYNAQTLFNPLFAVTLRPTRLKPCDAPSGSSLVLNWRPLQPVVVTLDGEEGPFAQQ